MKNGMDPLFWLQVFQKGSVVETSWTPPHKEKNHSCDLPVRAWKAGQARLGRLRGYGRSSRPVASDPGPHRHRIYDRQEEGLVKPPFFWRNKGLRFDLLRFRKSFAFRSWSTGTCYPASLLKIICTIVVVCSFVGTFVMYMFYEEETSSLLGWGRRPAQRLARKASSAIAGFVGMMTNRARLRHGTPFGADALLGEDELPFFRAVQADQGHACPPLLVTRYGVAPARQETGVVPDRKTCDKKKKKKKKKKRKEKHFVQSGL